MRKNKNKTILYGDVAFDVKTGKDVDINVTGLYIDNFNQSIRVTIQTGLEVKLINMSMEEAQYIGLININAIKDYC